MKRDVDSDFKTMQQDHPELANELLIRAELLNENFEQKNAYIKGALFIYSLFIFHSQAALLDELFRSTLSGDGVGEVPQL